jgi:hypothetical protein
VESYPLFIIGAPRSGTTFLCSVLNMHPLIQLTNESRVFVLLKEMLEVGSMRPDFLSTDLHDRFVAFGRRTAGGWIERFYREELGMTAPIWGDKHPPYADRTVLSGRNGSIERLPRSGSCLRLIRELLPQARFVHIHRDPGHVANSLVRRHWIGSVEDGIQVWGQYVEEILGFFDELPADQTFTLSYRSLIEDGANSAANIGRFLGLEDPSPISTFLAAQHHTPTPFSEPTTNIAELYAIPNTRTNDEQLLALAGSAAAYLGYAAA